MKFTWKNILARTGACIGSSLMVIYYTILFDINLSDIMNGIR